MLSDSNSSGKSWHGDLCNKRKCPGCTESIHTDNDTPGLPIPDIVVQCSAYVELGKEFSAHQIEV